jgi:hypothetical protein
MQTLDALLLGYALATVPWRRTRTLAPLLASLAPRQPGVVPRLPRRHASPLRLESFLLAQPLGSFTSLFRCKSFLFAQPLGSFASLLHLERLLLSLPLGGLASLALYFSLAQRKVLSLALELPLLSRQEGRK